MGRFVLIFAALAACYAPTIGDCAYTCNDQSDCPSSQSCDTAQHACRAAGATGACGGMSTPIDAPLVDALDAPPADAPAFDFTPSNYLISDLADLPAQPLAVTSLTTLDTDADSAGSKLISDGMGGMLRLYHVRSISVAAGATLAINGSSSAILSVDGDVTVAGRITGPINTTRPCATNTAAPGPDCSGGGAGGSYGGLGGSSGDCSESYGAAAQPAAHAQLVPLLGGCAGVASPAVSGAVGVGGGGGGGLEISSRTAIHLAAGGIIGVGGGGGHGGQIAAGNAFAGGGGGGAGGGLLLEAPLVDATGAAILCAAGGGGGAGAEIGGGTGGLDGGPGCASTDLAHLGGSGSYPGNTGGGAVGQPSTNGLNGYDVSESTEGGGGAGGGTGIIVVHAHTTQLGAASMAPQAITETF